MNLFLPLEQHTRSLLDDIPALIEKTFPLPARFRRTLPADVAELSRLLTSGRGERGLSYPGQPRFLSAYLRFYLPWNLYRLCRLLPGLDLTLAANDRITDLGCGPLTFAAALWISRPELRSLPLEFQCVDKSGPALDAGKRFFAALAGETWKIHTIKSDVHSVSLKPAALVCAVNVFNEMHGDISSWKTENIRRNAEKAAALLAGLSLQTGALQTGRTLPAAPAAILVAEPGFPRCGEFISMLRGDLITHGHQPVSPCPHNDICPFPGGGFGKQSSARQKSRWCHFAFETGDAPPALLRLSQAAGIPKERAVLSFIFTKAGDPVHEGVNLRIISDAFKLPRGRFGRYCCCRHGLALLAGEKETVEKTASGSLVHAHFIKGARDTKSGALMAVHPVD